MARTCPADIEWKFRQHYWQAVTRDDDTAVTPDGNYFVKAVKHYGIYQLLQLRNANVDLSDCGTSQAPVVESEPEKPKLRPRRPQKRRSRGLDDSQYREQPPRKARPTFFISATGEAW